MVGKQLKVYKLGIKERRLREKLKRKSDIIGAAETIIFDKGIQGATMSDIAKEAELGKATLYGYYKSKDEILLEINERAHNRLAAAFQAVQDETLSGIDQVRAIGYAYFKFAIDYPNYFKFIQLFESTSLTVGLEQVVQIAMKVDGILTQSIKKGMNDGTIRDDLNPNVMAKCLWAMATGVQQMIEQKGDFFCNYFEITGEMMFESFFAMIESGLIKK